MNSDDRLTRRSFLVRGTTAGGLAVLGGAAGAALTGCSSNPASSSTASGSPSSGSRPGVNRGTPKKGGSVTIGTMAEVNGLNPATAQWDTNGILYANTVYDPLMWVAADGTAQPYLAESLTPNGDFTVWTMTLRPGVTFSDGSDLTSTVVRNNFAALAASPLTGQAAKGIAVDTTSPLSLTYSLDQPRPHFPFTFTTQGGYVIGQTMLDQAAAGKTPDPVGTGPFVYSSWLPNSHFTATRNPNYWRNDLPQVDQITFVPITDSSQRAASLQSGGIDLMITTDPTSISGFAGKSGYQVVDSLSGVIGEPTVASIVLNTTAAPTDDLHIRQALAKAIDVRAVLSVFGGGLTTPINGLFLPGSPYYSDTGYPTYDPEEARALVDGYRAQHGAPSLTLSTITDPRLESLVEVVQQMWTQVGFGVKVAVIEPAELISNLVSGHFQASVDYQYGAVDPDLNFIWFSSTTTGGGGNLALNFSRNADPKIEAALQTGRTTTDQAVRDLAYKELNQRLAADLPNLWLEQVPFAAVGDQRVQNFAGLTLPDGTPGYGFDEGVFFPGQLWLNP
jgi:peptide/nickel transport system substrate-binding protein